MSRAHKFFRYLWRVNAVLILVAAAGLSVAVISLAWSEFGGSATRSRIPEAAPPLGAADSGERLFLGQVEPVEGTTVMRGELIAHRSGAGFGSGSGDYAQTRNIIFVDSESQPARWLLPDDDHVITAHPDVTTRPPDGRTARVVATLAVVKTADADLEAAEGVLLLFDPAGRNIVTVADGVRELHSAALDAEGRITLLFERRRKYVIAAFNADSLEKKQEHEVIVPPLK